MPEEKTVFISYRRSVSTDAARALFLDLRYNGYDVFLDVDSINSGQFERIILRQIEARAHFLLILTPGSVERCADKGDWLRREIEHAMDKQRNIVPLFYNGFSFSGTDKYLTGKLKELSRFNGMTVPHDYFDAAMDKLRTRFLQMPIQVAVKSAPASDQAVVRRKIADAAASPAQQMSADDYFKRGDERYDKKDYDGAITDYSEVIRLNPQDANAYNHRSIARLHKGDFDGAIGDTNEAIRLNPQDAEAYNNRGLARRNKRDLDSAIADYNQAIRLNPQYAEAYNNRGVAHGAKLNLDRAIADLTEAIHLNPQYADAYNHRGVVRIGKGDHDGAIADLTEAIRLNSQDADAYSNRGFARSNKGDYDGAFADYNEAIRLNPHYLGNYKGRGIVYGKQSNHKAAIADFQRYLNLGGGEKYEDRAQIEEQIRRLQKLVK